MELDETSPIISLSLVYLERWSAVSDMLNELDVVEKEARFLGTRHLFSSYADIEFELMFWALVAQFLFVMQIAPPVQPPLGKARRCPVFGLLCYHFSVCNVVAAATMPLPANGDGVRLMSKTKQSVDVIVLALLLKSQSSVRLCNLKLKLGRGCCRQNAINRVKPKLKNLGCYDRSWKHVSELFFRSSNIFCYEWGVDK